MKDLFIYIGGFLFFYVSREGEYGVAAPVPNSWSVLQSRWRGSVFGNFLYASQSGSGMSIFTSDGHLGGGTSGIVNSKSGAFGMVISGVLLKSGVVGNSGVVGRVSGGVVGGV